MVMSSSNTRILCVDDEPNVLDGLRRNLRHSFDVTTETEPAKALELARRGGPFAVVVSDLRMPEMDGIEFLKRMTTAAPDAVRVLLSGNADLDAAIAAVNEGSVFRFLSKPCPAGVLLRSLTACAEQHHLIVSERVLLEETLSGSIRTLADVLGLANPTAFGRATRVKQYVSELLAHLETPERWSIEVAALLSQIGCITLPQRTVEKLCHGEALSDPETEMVERMPRIVEELLANIPRLEPVREILLWHGKRFDGSGSEAQQRVEHQIPWGARVLKLVVDFDALMSGAATVSSAMKTLRARAGWYDPEILEEFAEARGAVAECEEAADLPLSEVVLGMRLAADVHSDAGMKIVAQGQEVSAGLLERLRNFSGTVGIREPISVFLSSPTIGGGGDAREIKREQAVAQ